MAGSYFWYQFYSYMIPFFTFIVIYIILLSVGEKARWFIVKLVIGLDRNTGKEESDNKPKLESTQKQSQNGKLATQSQGSSRTAGTSDQYENVETVKQLFSVEIADELPQDNKNPLKLGFILKCLGFTVTVAILTIFMTIIFQTCVLSFEVIRSNKKCSYDAECFSKTGFLDASGSYNCTKDEAIDILNGTNSKLTCFAWVVTEQKTNEVLDTIGTCGGLLGIVSCIVPLVYYITKARKSCVWLIICILLPLAPTGALIGIIVYMQPDAPSMLTVFTLAIVIAMTLFAYLWAVFDYMSWLHCLSDRLLSVEEFFKRKCCWCCCGTRSASIVTPYP